MANNRIFYPVHQVGIHADGAAGWSAILGAQSVNMSANVALKPVFILGQSEIYENVEEIPDVEVTISKFLDGSPLIWHEATRGSTTTSPTLLGRSVSKCSVAVSIFPDTNDSCTGTPGSEVQCSGMFPASLSYDFTVGDFFKEEVKFLGNHRVWVGDTNVHASQRLGSAFTGAFTSNNAAPTGLGGVNRRENLIFGTTSGAQDVNGMLGSGTVFSHKGGADITILPPDVFGITSSGTNELGSDGNYGAHVQSIKVSADLGREPIDELGRLAPYHRFVKTPLEVTTAIEVVSSSGDMVSFTESGIYSSTASGQCYMAGNLRNRTIRIATCEGTRIYTGSRNKLQSVTYGGGDTGGGNVTVTYTYKSYNTLTVMHEKDRHASGATWWNNRVAYLIN